MAFRAVHADWGDVLSCDSDLGCGQAWEALYRVKPPAPLSCPECGHRMFCKVSSQGMRFFAHAPHAPSCESRGESMAHHLLKLDLLYAARDAGGTAELEVRAPEGTWRADVLASDPAGRWRMALEAQLSPITAREIAERTERMRAHGVSCCWFSDAPSIPWFGTVPSLRVQRSTDSVAVVDGLFKFVDNGMVPHTPRVRRTARGRYYVAGFNMIPDRRWQRVSQVSIVDFLSWVFNGRVVVRSSGAENPPCRWTAPRYVAAEAAHLAEMEEINRQLGYLGSCGGPSDHLHRRRARDL